MTSPNICPCAGAVHPAHPHTPPGESWIAYRSGDFAAFRQALLRPLPGELELTQWRPGATHDLAVQIVDWWAYLADILTFYNEQYANEHYLRTAVHDEDVRRLVKSLGYRPRPGAGATATVAAIIKSLKPVQIPKGFAILSKPGPDGPPQTFELDEAALFSGVSLVDADPAPLQTVTTSILLAGEVASIVTGEKLLLIAGARTPSGGAAAWITVQSLATEISPRGDKNTRLSFSGSLPAGASASSLRLLRANQSSGLWPFPATTVAGNTDAHLAGLARTIVPGSFAVFEAAGTAWAASISSNTEAIWFANAPDSNNPQTPPALTTAIPLGIPHSVLAFTPVPPVSLNSNKATARVWFDWREAAKPIATPALTASGASINLRALAPQRFPVVTAGQPLLLEDALENGAAAEVTRGQTSPAPTVSVTAIADPPPLEAPLKALFHLLTISRGKTVKEEILGSGDATRAGQEFTLKKSPLTYLSPSYASTLRVWVDGIEWTEVPSFFGQNKLARIFVTREDDEQKTHVMFGDGVHGARLPSGASNVTASYRYESGAAVPETGKLTVLGKTLSGLTGIRNPVAPFGGADPDPADQLRKLAPKSVLTFGRAVSGVDYEVIASQAAGVDRARAYWSFDAARQTTAVTLYVGDTPGAVTAARGALALAIDDNKPLTILPAQARNIRVTLALRTLPEYLPDPVVAAVRTALLDPDTGLFGLHNARIGQSVFRSQIFAACLAIPGVDAVHDLVIRFVAGELSVIISGYRFFAGEGAYFNLADDDLTVTVENA